MATGYTAAIPEGISFRDYALNCARAFGACITLRDDPPGGDQIPDEFVPSDYHAKAIHEATEALRLVKALTLAECEARAMQAWTSAEANRLISLDRSRQLREAYEAMLVHVNAWEPPTPDHVGLRDFMRAQILQSIEFDCRPWGTEPTPRLSGEQWREKEAVRLAADIAYHTKEQAAEVERVAQRTAWVRALRASL